MINCTILDNGNLKITSDNETRHDIATLDGYTTYDTIWCELMEPYSCNGSYTYFNAGDANPFVGLTSAPCIAETMDYADNGDRLIVGRLWAFMDYQITDPLIELRSKGRVIFTFVGEN
jgi:hypothetical protein